MTLLRLATLCLLAFSLLASSSMATDWTRFLGENGRSQASDNSPTPTTWSETENLRWSLDLPGPGLSCPIVVGDKVFVTCWTGYAAGEGSSDDVKDLQRVLVCANRNSGEQLWSKTVDAVQPEETFEGMFAENGYASHTPVTDGHHVYTFYGKTGVFAYDLDGNLLWEKSVGTDDGIMGWGTASSPILYKDLLIVTAAAESKSLIALNKNTGQQVWIQQADSLAGTWSTPILVKTEGRTDLALNVPGEIWGLNPDTGKLRWYCKANESTAACPSLVQKDGVLYLLGGRDGAAIAVRAGGKGDVSESHVVWRHNHRGGIGSPVIAGDYLHWVTRGQAQCLKLVDGEEIYRERLAAGGGNRRGPGGADYASLIAADHKLYHVGRNGTTYVLAASPEFKLLATNQLANNNAQFNASPAIVDGQIFIRSTKQLYCIQQQ